MLDRLMVEIGLIRDRYGEVETGSGLEWVIIKEWPLPHGWNRQSTELLVLIPPGYPVTPPDNFYTDHDLRLANGQVPGNANANNQQLGRSWLQFSFHVGTGDWKPSADLLGGHNLQTFLQGAAKRLQELS